MYYLLRRASTRSPEFVRFALLFLLSVTVSIVIFFIAFSVASEQQRAKFDDGVGMLFGKLQSINFSAIAGKEDLKV